MLTKAGLKVQWNKCVWTGPDEPQAKIQMGDVAAPRTEYEQGLTFIGATLEFTGSAGECSLNARLSRARGIWKQLAPLVAGMSIVEA